MKRTRCDATTEPARPFGPAGHRAAVRHLPAHSADRHAGHTRPGLFDISDGDDGADEYDTANSNRPEDDCPKCDERPRTNCCGPAAADECADCCADGDAAP